MKNERGQILVVVILVLVIASVLIPVMVMSTQREAKFTSKQSQSTSAFHQAESGIEKGYLVISVSTLTWVNLQKGTMIDGFKCDVQYTDIPGGRYCVSISSGPNTQEATVISIGQDKLKKETRAIRAVYSNAMLGDIGVQAQNGVTMSGSNVDVEWGSVVSPKAITIGNKLHPNFFSASSMDKDASATPPNCDTPNCWWWHSFYSGIPPTPPIDFDYYKSSAIASGTAPCGMKYYVPASSTPWSTDCDDTSGKPFYVEGDWTSFRSKMNGTVIILGNMSWDNGNAHALSAYNATIPPQAWKQYCSDWTAYTAYDATFPYTDCSTTPKGYNRLGQTYNISPTIKGLLYIGGNLTIPNGGGNSDLVHGIVIVQGTADINTNSHAHIYYDPSTGDNLQTTSILLSRTYWADFLIQWPSSLP
ncbi:MAG: hypothetical protein HY078_08750 [Elusimicrobia bacterium]|nr:hypothetical protein [Elusimicrobiota bacterium]